MKNRIRDAAYLLFFLSALPALVFSLASILFGFGMASLNGAGFYSGGIVLFFLFVMLFILVGIVLLAGFVFLIIPAIVLSLTLLWDERDWRLIILIGLSFLNSLMTMVTLLGTMREGDVVAWFWTLIGSEASRAAGIAALVPCTVFGIVALALPGWWFVVERKRLGGNNTGMPATLRTHL